MFRQRGFRAFGRLRWGGVPGTVLRGLPAERPTAWVAVFGLPAPEEADSGVLPGFGVQYFNTFFLKEPL